MDRKPLKSFTQYSSYVTLVHGNCVKLNYIHCLQYRVTCVVFQRELPILLKILLSLLSQYLPYVFVIGFGTWNSKCFLFKFWTVSTYKIIRPFSTLICQIIGELAQLKQQFAFCGIKGNLSGSRHHLLNKQVNTEERAQRFDYPDSIKSWLCLCLARQPEAKFITLSWGLTSTF